MAKKLDYEYCKAAPMLEWLGNKWALVVLVKISENEPVRFNELYRNIPSVSEKVLSQVLRQLTTDGIIHRELFPDVPPARNILSPTSEEPFCHTSRPSSTGVAITST